MTAARFLAMKSFLVPSVLLAVLCSNALASPTNAGELVLRSEAVGKAIFHKDSFVGYNDDAEWEEEACSLTVTDIAGYTGVFGPWPGACAELPDLGLLVEDRDVNGTSISIDTETNIITFTDVNGGDHTCEANGLDDGQGCEKWKTAISPALHHELRRRQAATRRYEAFQNGTDIVPCTVSSSSHTKPASDMAAQHWVLHKQVTSNIECRRAPSCSVGKSQGRSFSIGWSATATVFEFITAGFSVTKTVNTGETYGCTQNKRNQVCEFKTIPHVAYSVRNYVEVFDSCSGNHYGDKNAARIRAPNSAQFINFYCQIDKGCHNLGYSFWKKA